MNNAERVALINELRRMVAGMWISEINESTTVHISLERNGDCKFSVSTYDILEKTKQIFTGPEWVGRWRVSAQRSLSTRQQIENSSIGSASSSVDLLNTMFGTKLDAPNTTSIDKSSDGELGFLVINFNKLPESHGNVMLLGFKVNVADIVCAVIDLFRDGNYKIVEFSDMPNRQLRLINPALKEEVWVPANQSSTKMKQVSSK